MTYCVSTATMRDSDAATIAAGVASTELMRRAAQGVFDRVEWRGRIAILCGKGNNGGDGLALAGILIERGFRPQVYLYAACSLSADAAYYREKLARIRYADVYDLQQWDGKADIGGDCLLGTGFRGEVRGDLRAAIETVNASGAYVVSVDIPSGLNGDSGRAPCAVRAHRTVAIEAIKSGLLLGEGKDCVGESVVAPIGIEIVGERIGIVGRDDVTALFAPRRAASHKGDYGKTLIVGGSREYVGAVKLATAARAALRAGCGLSAVAVPSSLLAAMQTYALENTLIGLAESDGAIRYDRGAATQALRGVRAVAIGMGLGDRDEHAQWLRHLLHEYDGNVLLDADALNVLARNLVLLEGARSNVLLTPHPAEMARLCGTDVSSILDDPIGVARDFARRYGCTVLLKGASSVISDGARTALMTDGTPALAKGGSGDTLCGVCLGIAARESDWFRAAGAAAYVCAHAARACAEEYGEYGVLASDVARRIALWTRRDNCDRDE